ncbi:MAG: 23S rRNA (uracil(1939)-C(5))-methyltransferase RlmD, partial [Eubacteriales bacterium]
MEENIFDTKRECRYAGKCGACQTLNLTYGEELSLKMKQEITLLGKFGHVEEIIPMEKPEKYRNKVQYLMQYNGGRVNFGLYRSSDGGIVHVDRCMMEDEEASAVCRTVRRLVDKFGLRVYDGRRGLLRHVLARRAFATGEILCAIVTTDEKFDRAREFAEELVRRIPHVKSVSRIINDTRTPLWLGGEEYVLYGSGYITDELCGCRFRISAKSFYQINPTQTEILYDTAVKMAKISKGERIADAYCGIGTVGIIAAKNASGELFGFDVNSDAVHDAEVNAKLNGIENARFICTDDASYTLKAEKKPDVLFMDPPRAGADRRFLNSVLRCSPDRVVYISCNPETLARDLTQLRQSYRIERIQPVDMFPGTRHVETVCLLSKLKSTQHIEVELDMDELDLTAAEKKATYDEIKAYVLEHSGL